MDRICRLCGLQNTQFRNLFEDEDELKHILRIIPILFSFKVESTETFTDICFKCIKLVNLFYDFYKKVKSVQISLNKYPYFNNDEADRKFFVNIKENRFDSANRFSNDNEYGEFHKTTIKEEIHSDDDSDSVMGDDYNCNLETKPTVDNLNLPGSSNSRFSSSDSNNKFQITKPIEITIEPTIESDNTFLFQNKKSDRRLPKKQKLKGKNLVQDCENDPLSDDFKNREDSFAFPSEIIKNGKLTYKGSSLEYLLAKFYNLYCDMCSTTLKFDSLQDLMQHYDVQHKTSGYVKCCNTKIFQHRSIYYHMARHLQPSAFECPVCKKLVSRPNFLKIHIQTHLPDSERPYQCEICSQRYCSSGGLMKHKKTHVPVVKRATFACERCDKKFTSNSSLMTHMNVIHSDAKFLCSECGGKFRRKLELKYHIMTHDKSGKNQVHCSQCGFICKNQQTLKIHMKRHLVKQVKCNMCDYSTYRQHQLTLHIRVNHSDEKPYVCQYCDKRFKLKNVLTTHLAQHTGEHKYACAYCPKTFASSGNYHTHRKRMHAEKYQNEQLTKQKKQYKNLEEIKDQQIPNENVEDNSIVHEFARKCLKKLANINRKK